MSKVAKTVGIIAGVVALSIALPGVGTALGLSAATTATVASVASAISAAAMAVSQATMKPPDMRGTINEVMIGSNMPVPYAVGRTYVGGNKVYEDSANTNNYDRTQIFVYSHAGPIEEFQALQADFTTIAFSTSAGGLIAGVAAGYYGADGGYLWADSRKGLRPDTALAAFAGRAAFRDWGASHKLSGMACASVTMEFDEDGKRWSSGIPQWGMVGKWVKAYDPRLDGTYPGGSGPQRWADEATWTWTENPALHALAYARGRFMNGKKVVGAGLAREAILVDRFVTMANLAEANGWTCGGVVYEAPGLNKWDNLKRFLAAAAAEPVWVGGMLGLRLSAPVTPLDTISADDLADGPIEIKAMRSWHERMNTVVPRYRSEAHKWDYVQAEAVTATTYVTEDGETKTQEIQFDLVQDKDQAAELAAYAIVNGREFSVSLTVKPRLMAFRPGEALELDIPEAGLNGQAAVITARRIDPATGMISLTLDSETSAKHAFALGRTGTAPPTPTIYSPEEIDEAVSGGNTGIYTIDDLPAASVTADHAGTVAAGQLPRVVQARLRQGAQDVTTDAAWSLSTDSGSISASIGAGTGAITITALGSSSVLTATAQVAGVAKSRKLEVIKQVGAPPAGGGGGGSTASDSTFEPTSSATMVQISGDLEPTVGPLGEVVLSAPLNIYTSNDPPVGDFPVYGIWREWNGAAWIDVGSEVASSLHASVAYEDPSFIAYPGTVTVNPPTITGRTPGAVPRFALFARNDSGTRARTFSGTASAVGR